MSTVYDSLRRRLAAPAEAYTLLFEDELSFPSAGREFFVGLARQDGYLAPEARRQLPAAVTVVDGVSGAFDEENASWEQLSYLNINDSISQLTAIVKKCEATAVIVDGMQTCMALHGVSGAMDWMEGAAAIEGLQFVGVRVLTAALQATDVSMLQRFAHTFITAPKDGVQYNRDIHGAFAHIKLQVSDVGRSGRASRSQQVLRLQSDGTSELITSDSHLSRETGADINSTAPGKKKQDKDSGTAQQAASSTSDGGGPAGAQPSSGAAADPEAALLQSLPFKLSLTEAERAAREKVQLPYQHRGGYADRGSLHTARTTSTGGGGGGDEMGGGGGGMQGLIVIEPGDADTDSSDDDDLDDDLDL